MKILSYGNSSIQNIQKLEETFEIKLPQDYREFLLLNNGADITDGIFYVKDLKEKILMGGFYHKDSGVVCKWRVAFSAQKNLFDA